MVNSNEDCFALCLTEHWKTEEQLKNCGVNDFKLVSCYCREEGEHGGAAVYIRENLASKPRNDIANLSEKSTFECAAAEVCINKTRIVVLSVYRTENPRILIEKLDHIFCELVDGYCVVLLAGDFNLDILLGEAKWPTIFKNALSSFNITPSITEPTRIKGNRRSCIDNIYTNLERCSSKVFNPHTSDHTAQIVTFEIGKTQTKYLRKRIFNKESKELFKFLLGETDWAELLACAPSEVDLQWEEFTNVVKAIFNQCFPLKKFQPQKHCRRRWMGAPEIISCKKRLDILYILSTGNNIYREEYKAEKRRYNALLTESRKNFYQQKLENCDNKSKVSWQIIREIRGNSGNSNILGLQGEPHALSNEINQFMTGAASDATKKMKQTENKVDFISTPESIYLSPVSEAEVTKIIKGLKNKHSSGFDEISTDIIKLVSEEIVPPVSYIINNSFVHGHFPQKLKLALIKPLHKKGDPAKVENYRPISLLSSFSKIFERAMYNRLEHFFISKKIFKNSQHGFLKGKSTETAIYDFLTKILENLEAKNKTLGAFLDLSKAFDSLDHQLLLKKLELYGVRGPALDWLRSFITGRFQRVCLEMDGERTLSDIIKTDLGIAQGSTLGPFLFLVYINDLSDSVVDDSSSLVNFADDSNCLFWADTLELLFSRASEGLRRAENWFSSNKLLLNCEKSVFLYFRTVQSQDQVPESIYLFSQNVELSNSVRFLGIYIDQHLQWDVQLQYVCRKLNSACFSIRVLKDYLQKSTLLTVYYANFYSTLRYGVIFWGDSAGSSEVFVIQKKIVRVILGMRSRDSCRGKFRQLNILTFSAVYIFECVVFLFKHFSLFEHLVPNHNHNTRTQNLTVPSHRLTLTEKSPLYACVRFYNKLSPAIKHEKCLKVFKKNLFQHLINVEPYSIAEFMDFLPPRGTCV